jgi:hypothetical protein
MPRHDRAVLRNERCTRPKSLGHFDLSSLDCLKHVTQKVIFADSQLRGEHDSPVISQRKQVAIERLIVNGR